MLGSCRATFRLSVPDNVPVEIETSSGRCGLAGVRASVQVSTGSGRDHGDRVLRLLAARELGHRRRRRGLGVLGGPAGAALAQRRRARGRPAGRYQIDAQSDTGDAASRGLTDVDDAPFQIQALSTSGDVTVEAAVMTAALDLSPHLRAARRTLLYLIVGLGQGLTYLLVIGGGLLLGVLLAPLWVGLPLLTGTARLAWRLAEGERRQANRLLETHLPPVPPPPARERRARGARQSASFWRVLAMLLLKLPIALAGLALAAARRCCWRSRWPALGVSGLAGDDGRLVGPWALGPAVGLALCLLALPAAIVSIAALEGVGAGAARARPLAAALARGRGRARCASCSPSASATAR